MPAARAQPSFHRAQSPRDLLLRSSAKFDSNGTGRLLLVKPAKWPKKNSRLPSFPASSASRIACFWMSSPQLTRCREARAWTKRLWQQNVIIIASLRKKKKFAEIKSTPIMGFYQFHPIPSKVRSLQLAPGQLSARSPWLKPGDGNWPGLVANTFNDLLQLFLAGTALMLSHMKRRETSHQFVLSLFSTIVASSCHSIGISQACGKLSWKLAPICSGR